MKKGAPSALVFLIPLAVSAHAYELSPTPEAGLWRSEKRVLIEGEDRIQPLDQAQQQLSDGTASDRRRFLDNAAVIQNTPTVEMECITLPQAAELVRLENMQREIQRDVPECELTVHPVDRSTLNVHGNCQGEDGFEGDMQGHVEIVSSYEIRSSFLGRSRLQTESDIADRDTPTRLQLQEISRWTQADCGEMEPEKRMSF